jgi:hypothetical protein
MFAILGASHQEHQDFCAVLGEWLAEKKRKGQLTEVVARRTAQKLARFNPETCLQALTKALESGWTGVFPESVKPSQTGAITAQPELSQWGFGD